MNFKTFKERMKVLHEFFDSQDRIADFIHAELIQTLVDDLRLLRIEFGNRVGQTTEIGIASLYAAEAAGFKPTAADRAKDAELIQMAVDMAHSRAYEWTDKEFRAALCDKELAFLAAAKAAGFKPSDQ